MFRRIRDALRRRKAPSRDIGALQAVEEGEAFSPPGLTTDPNDPRLGHGSDTEPGPQNEVYLVLSEEERAKGFVRPVRRSYQHVGPIGPQHPLAPLTDEQKERTAGSKYVMFEAYPDQESPVTGRYWTQEQLDRVERGGCGQVTRMGKELAETYAREPGFYGATYCCGCRIHKPVAEFVWDGTEERVGS